MIQLWKLRGAWAIGSTSALAIGVVFLFVQHWTHGWPFCLHHGVNAEQVTARAASPVEAQPSAPVAHPRHAVSLGVDQMSSIGLRVETVKSETLAQPIRATATVVPDESRLSHVHTRVSGWLERLSVSTTGQLVRAGQPIAGIFSQELLTSQNEYLAARRGAANSPRSLVAEAARARLGVMGMTDAEISAIDKTGEARRLVTVVAPRSGVVLRRGVTVGTAVDPSTELLTIADLSRVWVLAEVSEADIPSLAVGARATLDFPASGIAAFEAPLAFLYPTLSERTRTLRVRFEVDNPTGSLRPGIYGSATFALAPRETLTVNRDAVVDTGAEQHVFVQLEPGKFEPRRVTLGARVADRVEIRSGLAVGEAVVAAGVFLLDSESRLRASGGGLAHAHGRDGSEAVKSAPVAPSDSPAHAPPQGAHQGH